jgi:hypothetical protein
MPTIDLTDDEYAAVTAAIRRAIETDRFPHAPRLDPLRAALAKFDAAPKLTPEPPLPKTLPGARGRQTGAARAKLTHSTVVRRSPVVGRGAAPPTPAWRALPLALRAAKQELGGVPH